MPIENVQETQDGSTGNGAAATNQQTASTTSQPAFIPTKDEWVDMRREQRQIKELLRNFQPSTASAQEKTAPPVVDSQAGKSTADARMDELEFRIALKDALADAGIVEPKLRGLIEAKAKLDKPTDLRAFLADYTGFSPVKEKVQEKSTAPSDTGQPVGGVQSTNLPSNPNEWPLEVINKTSPADMKAAVDAHFGAISKNHNPYKGLKRPHER